MEVPSNTAVVVCREKGGILNILLSPLSTSGAHASQEEVARCLEAVNHAASFGNEAAAAAAGAGAAASRHHAHHLLHSRSLPNMPSRQGSQLGLAAAAAPADSMTDSGTTHPVPSSPMGFGGGPGGALSFGRLAPIDERGGGQRGGALVSVGEDDQLTGHSASVMCLTVANGLLFSGSTDATIKVWEVATCPAISSGKQTHSTARCPAQLSPAWRSPQTANLPCVHCCSTAPAAALYGCLQVWSLAASKCVATLRGHRAPIRKLEIVGGRLLSGGAATHIAGLAWQVSSSCGFRFSTACNPCAASHRLQCTARQAQTAAADLHAIPAACLLIPVC